MTNEARIFQMVRSQSKTASLTRLYFQVQQCDNDTISLTEVCMISSYIHMYMWSISATSTIILQDKDNATIFKLIHKDDELHSRVNFHISCEQRGLSEDESVWIAVRATKTTNNLYNLLVSPKSNETDEVELEQSYPVIGVITPYYVQHFIDN